jgi:serine/threonine protein phosphatase PrpC
LCSDGKAIPLSCDQRPKRTDEQDRISASGGFVGRTETEARSLSKYKGLRRKLVQFAYSLKLHRYPYRVYPGGIAVSRSLGDLEIKNSGLIISEAETIRRKLGPKDEFIILACDGLWDVMSNTDAVSHVKTYRQAHGNHPKKAAKSLVFEAYQRNSMDNITAICIFFSVTNPHSQYQNDSTNVVD